MRFDTIIIGGGLAGLTAGIKLQEEGRRTAIVSSGQSALHFFSGSFESLQSCPEAEALMERAGVRLHNFPKGRRLLPGGAFREAVLSLGDVSLLPEGPIGKKALIVSFNGYHDFFPELLSGTLEKEGTPCTLATLEMTELEALRKSPSEMRSVNIARVLDRIPDKLVQKVKELVADEDVVILPQVFGLDDDDIPRAVSEGLEPLKTVFVGTLPPSVPGIRTQNQLRRRYERLGGTFIIGDSVVSAAVHEGVVSSIASHNLDTYRLFADNFILCSGSFFSKGLHSSPSAIEEPVFGLDVESPASRGEWYKADFFDDQPYMGIGVKADKDLHPSIGGVKVSNLYVAGAILGASKDGKYGTGAGKAIRTALAVANKILSL